MFNPHPPLTAFPLVLTTLVVVAECASRWWKRDAARRFASVLLRILCAIAPVTYYSGYWGAEYANQTFQVSDDIIAWHQALAKFYLMSLIPCLALSIAIGSESESKPWLRLLYLASLLLSFALVLLTGAQGGDLVFMHGAGVSATP